MKQILLLTALAIALPAPANAANFLSRLFGKDKPAEPVEVLRMDPLVVSDGIDLSYSAPVPVRIVRPRVHTKYIGTQFELKFTVDKNGTPYNLGSSTFMVDSELVFQVISAVRAWHFSPARDSYGNAIERKVILPVIVVAGRE